MLKGLRPPTHRVDAPAVYIPATDPAWDMPRILAELDELVAMKRDEVRREAVEAAARERGAEPDALPDDARREVEASVVLAENEREEARNRHPFQRYQRGETRFDLTAADHGPRGPVASVLDYLKPGEVPTMIHLRRLTFRQRAEFEVDARVGNSPVARWIEVIRCGVIKIAEDSRVLWAPSSPGESIPDEWIERLADATATSDSGRPQAAHGLMWLAAAVLNYSAPPTESEGKR